MEWRAELLDIAHDLRVVRVAQADQLVFFRKARETFWDVGMRPPARHGHIELFGLSFDEVHAGAFACAAHGVDDDVAEGLPGAEHFVATIGGEQLDEVFQRVAVEAVAVDFPRQVGHAEVDEGAVAIEGDEFRLEVDHVFSLDE